MAENTANTGWQHYWRENRLAACVPDNPASAAAIEEHWSRYFAALPAGTRVLDIATGNGVLLVWAARAARHDLELTGVDLADIDPARFLPEYREQLASASFVGNTPAESLPFEDGSFDIVVSQYGLEYADLEPALAEVARVLVPGGRCHWLAHGADSIVVSQGHEQLADIELLLATDGPFASMQAYTQARASGRKVQQATGELTRALKSAEAHCAANPPATLMRQLCGGILETANGFDRYQPAAVLDWLTENRKRLRSQRERTSDLLAACLSGDRLARVRQCVDAPPWSVATISGLMAAGYPVGQLIDATRG